MNKLRMLLPSARSFVILLALITVSLPLVSQEAEQKAVNKYPPVPVPNTELRSLWSDILKQELLLFIKLPPAYYSEPQKTFQSLYMTDANRNFPMTANLADVFDAVRPVEPQFLIIGIGYRIQDMGEFGAWRTRDLTPTNVPAADSSWTKMFQAITGKKYTVRTGGSAAFLECIEKEIIPFVERNYRVSPHDRGLGGYSYGGLFTLYAMFKKPDLFTIYYAGSPSCQHDKNVIFSYEEDYARSHKDLEAKLMMTAGELEGNPMILNMNKMADILRSRSYPGLTVETFIFPGQDHNTCYPSSFLKALRVLYNR
jgi:predicted alpha/beta superfamily hydrolase